MLFLQIAVWKFLHGSKGSDVLPTKQAILHIVITQYIPRFVRFIPLTSELKKTAGAFAEGAWAGAAYYLLWYMLASHVSVSKINCRLIFGQQLRCLCLSLFLKRLLYILW